jgi:DNA-binding transcriptional regulator YdaS (Cro superfamily)
MDIAVIIKKAGGASALGRAVGLHHSTILGWKRVPAVRVAQVAHATGLTREQIRPDIFGPDDPPSNGSAS